MKLYLFTNKHTNTTYAYSSSASLNTDQFHYITNASLNLDYCIDEVDVDDVKEFCNLYSVINKC